MARKVPGFSTRQRKWFLTRDGNRCSIITFSETGGWKLCTSISELQIHHLIPRGWFQTHLMGRNWDVNGPDNGITLCSLHHVGKRATARDMFYVVHPEAEQARLMYGQGHYGAFEESFRDKSVLCENGFVYWNTRNDWQFHRTVTVRNAAVTEDYPYHKNRWWLKGGKP